MKSVLKTILFLGLSALSVRSELPSNLVSANWIESKGGYINTGINQYGSSLSELDCVLEFTTLNYPKRRLMGFNGAGPKNYVGISPDNKFDLWNVSQMEAESNVKYHLHLTQDPVVAVLDIYSYNENPENEVLLEKMVCNANGINNSECQLFIIASNPNYHCYDVRLYNFKILLDGELKRDFSPVMDIESHKAGMYDSVSGETFYASNEGKLICDALDYSYGEGESKVCPDGDTLYLPSYADYSNLDTLTFPAGTVLSGTTGESLTVGTDALDMRVLFGDDMEAGERYPVTVSFPSGAATSFFIAKSANIPALFVNLDATSVEMINKSKANSASGAALKIAPDGTASPLLEVKKFAGRGNTSWTYSGDKKPYKINLAEKYNLIASKSPNKKFALLSLNLQDRKDRSCLKEFVAHELAESMDMSFVPGMEFVDLYVNGSYRGIYVIKERITIGSDRINIHEPKFLYEDETSTTRVVQQNGIKGVDGAEGDEGDEEPFKVSSWNVPAATETILSENDDEDPALKAGIQAYQYATGSQLQGGKDGGVIIEMNVCYSAYLYDEPSFFITRRGQIFNLKTSECGTKEQVQRIAIFVQEMEDALFSETGFNAKGKHYSKYIDVASMAKHVALDGFMANSDFCIISTYFYIDADPATGEYIGKLKAEPVWDYDFAQVNSSHIYVNSASRMCYVPHFFNKADFVKALYEIQNDENGFTKRIAELNGGELDDLAAKLMPTYKLNFLRWGSDSVFDSEVLRNSMRTREASWNSLWKPETQILGAWVDEAPAPQYSFFSFNASESADISVFNYGTAGEYQWYKLDEEDNSLKAIEGETEATIDPTYYGKGEYICAISGVNLEPQAGGQNVTLYTAPFVFGAPEPGMIGMLLAAAAFLLRRK